MNQQESSGIDFVHSGIDFVHSQKMEDRAWLRLQKTCLILLTMFISVFYIPPLGTTGTTSTSYISGILSKKKLHFLQPKGMYYYFENLMQERGTYES